MPEFKDAYNNINKYFQEMKVPSEIEQAILNFIGEKGSATRRDIIDCPSLKSTNAYNMLKALVEQGKLVTSRSGKITVYRLPENE